MKEKLLREAAGVQVGELPKQRSFCIVSLQLLREG